VNRLVLAAAAAAEVVVVATTKAAVTKIQMKNVQTSFPKLSWERVSTNTSGVQ